MAFPRLPPQIRDFTDKLIPGFWSWYQDCTRYWSNIESLTDSGSVILRSPDGSRWKVSIDDSGVLHTTKL